MGFFMQYALPASANHAANPLGPRRSLARSSRTCQAGQACQPASGNCSCASVASRGELASLPAPPSSASRHSDRSGTHARISPRPPAGTRNRALRGLQSESAEHCWRCGDRPCVKRVVVTSRRAVHGRPGTCLDGNDRQVVKEGKKGIIAVQFAA